MLCPQQRKALKAAYQKGALRVLSVSPGGVAEWKRVVDVQRTEVPWETIHEVYTSKGPMILTAGHRVFINPTSKKEAKDLVPGDGVLGADGTLTVLSNKADPPRRFMYDLTAEDWHNFVLVRSGAVVSNSPDKFYHFRPPEHEGQIGQYNRIFGQIWEDQELKLYLELAIDDWDTAPPSTSVRCIDNLCNKYTEWRGAITWQALAHALHAVSINWVADEFDYSIGGVSLSIDKSSKYESLKSNAEGQFDKQTEAKARTVKYIKGLQQPRFGIGIRSAFGPNVGRGVLSPRNFLVLPLFLLGGKLLMEVLPYVDSLSSLWS